ncbi:PIN domain-containing protein [Frankia sp. Cas3]|uniref:PIN domain-containing protein n=1 Tax=Frankia sp. Cas3 TaxID=3073926 RepID=UPI002AD305C5|nr:PIN domain-containing protein [Frankia sp. Cas3]
MRTVVLDAGALIALERRDTRMLALATDLVVARVAAHLPAGVLAQVWRGSPRQHAVMKLVRTGALRVEPLSEEIAVRLGLLLAASGTSDVVDAHVALLARKLRATVITSDPHDLHKLDPTLGVVVI